jgi:preprotein translocase subunit SecA
VILSVLDRRWREHLYEMDYLQEGIGLRGYGQRDPLVEYQREAFDMFGAMMDGIKEESVGFLFNLDVQPDEAPPEAQPEFSFEGGTELDGPAASPFGELALGGPPLGISGEPVPSSAPAAFDDGVEDQGPPAPSAPVDERQKVADVLGQVLGQPNRPAGLQYSAPTVDGEGGVTRSSGPGTSDATSAGNGAGYGDVARNAPCPCGSGRKFKRCHGAPANR